MENFFHIYNASAGSGKTFTLVKRYLSILFNSNRKDSYKNILAITFTNKAVGEMKKRIIESLASFSKEDSAQVDPLMTAIMEETNLSEKQIREKSREILKSIIHNYAAFEISTIDGFTHRVIRTFARDLGIPMNFEVEIGAEDILMEAVDSLINRAGNDEKLTRVLVNYTLSKTDDDRSWDISRDLYEISRLLINENHQKEIAVLKTRTLEDFAAFAKKLRADMLEAEEGLKTFGDHFFEVIQNAGLSEENFKGKYIPKHFEKLQQGDMSVAFESAWAKNIADSPMYAKTKASKDIQISMDSLQPEIVEIFENSKKLFFHLEFLTEIRKNLVQLSLINEINREIELIKKEKNVILISEFNPKISEQVKDQPAPFIYERLGERYQHYFIDEFQDTSTMQWENLVPLISHNLSQGEEASGITIVGDAKQSIYRWRGGRAEQLIDLSNKKTSPFQVEQVLENLPNNFRSGSTVVNFNNSFFQYAATLLTHPEYADLFKNSAQSPKKGEFGYVNVSFVEAKNAEEQLEVYPQKIFATIKELEEQGYSKQDICILTRRKKEGIAIAEYLSEQGISVISSETLLVSQSSEVKLIADLLKFSLYPEDDQLKLKIYEQLSPRYISEEESFPVLVEHLPKNGQEFLGWLDSQLVSFDLMEIKRLSIYEAAEYIIRSFELVQQSNAYIQFFLDFIFESAQKTSNSLHSFLELWERKKDRLSIVVPETDDAVQIMTIHKSKGLEFPVVIYPFADADLQNTRMENLWLSVPDENIPLAYVSASKKLLNWNKEAVEKYNDLLSKNELDTLNLLYVACTRAAEQLYIMTSHESSDKKTLNISGILKNFLESESKYDDSLVCEFGEKLKYSSEEKKGKTSIFPEQFYTSPVQNKAVNIVTRSGAMWDTKQQEAIEKGEIAHEILARINSSQDLEKAMDWAVNSGLIREESRTEISATIEKIIQHKELKHLFAEDVQNKNEKEIITQDGNRLRPDRLNFSNNKITIIDYKTGGFVDTHTRQVSEYAKAMTNMGYEVEKSLLVYTNEPVQIRIV
ncbi:exodeoxyribonuclease V subunit beta [uncultured Christiangramia sp.]|uniref:UvrD-helicase domain-containing protein n=1 Tax=uncultured Christiangramia sp. TaxID=503836 RepID=UPI0025FFEAB8|nr:UvrD-helicase domain-containing protein [uncultured Christiangramia sp.]